MTSGQVHTDEIRRRLATVIGIPVTPFQDDGQHDRRSHAALIDCVIASGVSAITPNGNTSEFYALTLQEQKAAIDISMDHAHEALIIPGVGADVATAAEMASYVQRAGAHGVMVHQPVHPHLTDDGWIRYHQRIAERIDDLPVVLYLRDARISNQAVTRLLERCPSIVGIKYAVADPMRFSQLVLSIGAERVVWLCGLAESWAPFFWIGGAIGFTSGLVNVTAEYSLALFARLQARQYDEAMKIWAHVKPFEELRDRRNAGNNVAVVKEALAQLGRCGRYVRPPSSELSEQERQEVASTLKLWGLGQSAAR